MRCSQHSSTQLVMASLLIVVIGLVDNLLCACQTNTKTPSITSASEKAEPNATPGPDARVVAPIISLRNANPWTAVPGTDSPIIVVYGDGTVIAPKGDLPDVTYFSK